MSDLTRHVDDVVVHVPNGDRLQEVARGVTHYRFPWRDHIVGEGLRHELVAAGLPAWLQVTAYPQPDGSTVVDVSIPGDDAGKLQSKVEKVLDRHEGTEAKDHVALVEFAGSVREAAQRMADGGQVSQSERDIVAGIRAGRLV